MRSDDIFSSALVEFKGPDTSPKTAGDRRTSGHTKAENKWLFRRLRIGHDNLALGLQHSTLSTIIKVLIN